MPKKIVCIIAACLIIFSFSGGKSLAQNSLEFISTGLPSVGNGPTLSAQTITFYNNIPFNGSSYYPNYITATFSLSNQQYLSNVISPGAGTCMGASTSSSSTAASSAIFNRMDNDSGPNDNMFASTISGVGGINVTLNHSVKFYSSVNFLQMINAPTTGKYYYCDISITFSRPVSDPILHVVGLGGGTGSLGFTTDLELASFSAKSTMVSLSKIAGNSTLGVSGNTILNTSNTFNNSSTSSSASGSILINGEAITTLRFKQYIRGDGVTPVWANANTNRGEVFSLALSVPSYEISGNVFNDGDGLLDNKLDGNKISSIDGAPLFISLLDEASKLITTNAVLTDGNFSITATRSKYYLILTTTPTGSTTSALYPGWLNIDNLAGKGTSFNTRSGKSDLILVAGADIGDVNFSLNKRPNTDNRSQIIPKPVNGVISAGTIARSISGYDFEDGILDNTDTIIIKALPLMGTMSYNNLPVSVSQLITGFNPSLLSFSGIPDDAVSVSFKYAFKDTLGYESRTAATYTLSWEPLHDEIFGKVEAVIANGMLQIGWTTIKEIECDHFDVEISKDSLNYVKIGKVNSQATGGSSLSEINYEFEYADNGALCLSGISMSVVFVLSLFVKRRRAVYFIVLITGLYFFIAAASCSKKDVIPDEKKSCNFSVRIAHVDEDGVKTYSFIAPVIKK